jgi:hypothetical protein
MELPVANIVKGHVNELLGLNEDISEKRMKICRNCPIYISRLGGICNSNLFIDPITNDVSLRAKDGYVQGCGCRLSAKTTLPNEQCVAGKW